MGQIVLIGMPRSGKSTCGAFLAKELNYSFIDIDNEIEAQYQKINKQKKDRREIFTELGNDHYRKLESDAFISVSEVRPSVIATGGGTPIYTPEFPKLTKDSFVVFLYCTMETLWERMQLDPNFPPPYLDKKNPYDSFKELYKKRLVHYLNLCNVRIDTTEINQQEIIEKVLSFHL